MKTIPPLIRTLLAGAAAFLLLNPIIQAAGSAFGLEYPVLKVPAVSVFHRAYAPDSAKLKAALTGSKGDREDSEVTLALSEYIYRRDYFYHGQRMQAISITKYDPRTGSFATLTTQVRTDPDGRRQSTVDNDPMPITAERRSFFCQSSGGKVSEKIEVKSKCMLIHRVTRPAKFPATHRWNPVDVGLLFFTSPMAVNCDPVTQSGKTLKYEVSLMPGGTREFDIAAAGFKDEACEDFVDSILYFLPSTTDKFILPSNGK